MLEFPRYIGFISLESNAKEMVKLLNGIVVNSIEKLHQ
jgi:hypothetical protein